MTILMRRDVNVAPVVGRNLSLRVLLETDDIRLEHVLFWTLIDWQPRHVVNELLLYLVVGLRPRIWVTYNIGSIHLFLEITLLSCCTAVVIAKVELVVGLIVTKLERNPVLRVGVVCSPAASPHLQGAILSGRLRFQRVHRILADRG